MAAPPLANTFEGGTDGVAISAANSAGASGDALHVTGGTLCLFSNTHPSHGAMGMGITTADTTTTQAVDFASLGSLTGSVYARCYLYVPVAPAGADFTFCRFITSGNVRAAQFAIRGTGQTIRYTNAAGSAIGAGTVAAGMATLIRVEMRVLASATVGQAEFRLYNTFDAPSASYDDTVSFTAQNTGADINALSFGVWATAPTAPFTTYFDDVAVSTTGWIGPLGSTYTESGFGAIG